MLWLLASIWNTEKDLVEYIAQMRRIAAYGGPACFLRELNDQRLDNYYNQRSDPAKPQLLPHEEIHQLINKIRLALHPDIHENNRIPARLKTAATTMTSYIETLKKK